MITDTENMQQRSTLQLPLQVAPVSRVVVASSLTSDGGISPSFDLWDFVKKAGGIISQL